MITLKAIHNSFPQTKHVIFHTRRVSKSSTLSFCTANDSEAAKPEGEGDTRSQELLARIAMLQTQKVRLADYLDERSAYLTQFAEEANAEFDAVGENALKELDEAGTRIMGNLESQMQAFEETAELNKQEIEQKDIELAILEDQIEENKNEGLFFKNLGQKKPVKPVDIAKAKEETEKIKRISNEIAGSKIRKNIYLGLIGLLVIGITDALTSASDWRKVATLGVILVGLVLQFTYEQKISSETNEIESKKRDEDKKL